MATNAKSHPAHDMLFPIDDLDEDMPVVESAPPPPARVAISGDQAVARPLGRIIAADASPTRTAQATQH